MRPGGGRRAFPLRAPASRADASPRSPSGASSRSPSRSTASNRRMDGPGPASSRGPACPGRRAIRQPPRRASRGQRRREVRRARRSREVFVLVESRIRPLCTRRSRAMNERPSRRREHGAVPALGVAHKLSPAGSASGRTSTSGWRREPVWAHAGGRQAQGPRGQPASGEAGRTSLTASSSRTGEATSSAASSSRLPPRASRVRALGRAQAGIESRSVQRASGPRASRAL